MKKNYIYIIPFAASLIINLVLMLILSFVHKSILETRYAAASLISQLPSFAFSAVSIVSTIFIITSLEKTIYRKSQESYSISPPFSVVSVLVIVALSINTLLLLISLGYAIVLIFQNFALADDMPTGKLIAITQAIATSGSYLAGTAGSWTTFRITRQISKLLTI